MVPCDVRGRILPWTTIRTLATLGVCGAMALAFGIWSSNLTGPQVAAPSPQAGILDLGGWHFARDGSVRLAGQWLYFDRRWVPRAAANESGAVKALVPAPWPEREGHSGIARRDGFGTYTLTLHMPVAPAGDTLAIDTGQVLAAYRLFANGALIASRGIPSETAAGEVANSYSALVDLPPGAADVELSLEISNHVTRFGGIFVAPIVGLKSTLLTQRELTQMLSLIVIGALFFTACYHIAFLRVTRAGSANLWFGALAALFGGRMFLFDPLAAFVVPLIGQDWVWRLDVATTVLLLPAAYWFFAISFPSHISRRLGNGLAAICTVFALASIVGGPVVGELTLKAAEILGIVTIPYLSQAIIRSAMSDEYGARLALLGWAICALSAFHDILLDNHFIVGSNFLPLGSVAFFLSLSGALTQRSHHAFVRVELLVDERTHQLREKISELELARAAAVSANIAKSRFLANMSHELRTPLNAILGFSEIIRDRVFGEEVSPRYADYAGSIHMSGRHLLGLITDILDLAKIEAVKFELLETRVELGDEPQTRRKNVSITLSPGEPQWVFADARALRQILLNLLSNALKFTPSGGTIALSVAGRPDGTVAIAVKDNGIGIRPEDMERIFESFGQGQHETRPTNERGTGLGLPICRGLAEAMGGGIEIASTVNVGTTVIVLLPARRRMEPLPLAGVGA